MKPELSGDGVHPNAAGYAIMAPIVERAIAEAIRGAASRLPSILSEALKRSSTSSRDCPATIRQHDDLSEEHLQLLPPDLREHALILPEDRVGERALRRLQLEDLLLDRVARDEPRRDHVAASGRCGARDRSPAPRPPDSTTDRADTRSPPR